MTEAAGSAPIISGMANQSPPVSRTHKVHTLNKSERFATDLVCQGTFSTRSSCASHNTAYSNVLVVGREKVSLAKSQIKQQ